MAKQYRNALRSKRMLRKAFVELSAEKEADKITVIDVVNRADLSRNTFYAHYPDVKAIAEEIENELIDRLNLYLDQEIASHALEHPMPLLRRFEQFVLGDEEEFQLLVHTQHYSEFLEKFKGIFFNRLIDYIDDTTIRDKYGFLVFIRVVASGVVELYTQYLKKEIDLSLKQINEEINRIYIAGVVLYQ